MIRTINFNSILPIEVKVFYENGEPYLWYKGKVSVSNNKECYITFPKINLKMETASVVIDANFFGKSTTLDCTFVPSYFTDGNEILRIEEVPLIKEEENLFKF